MAAVMERSTARVPHNPEKSDRVVVHLPKVLSEAIEAYQQRKRIGTRAEALRRLLQVGMETEEAREPREGPRP